MHIEVKGRKFIDEPYIAHPIRVMELVRICHRYGCAGTPPFFAMYWKIRPFQRKRSNIFLSTLMNASTTERTVRLVDELTDRFIKDSYPQWNRRVRKSRSRPAGCCQRKMHKPSNTQISSITVRIASQETDFSEVFLREWHCVIEKNGQRKSALWQRALKIVAEELEKLKKSGY